MPKIPDCDVAPEAPELVPTPRKPSLAERAAERDVTVGLKLRNDYLAMTNKIQRLRALRVARDISIAKVPAMAPKKTTRKASKLSN